MVPPSKVLVRLTLEQRRTLERFTHAGVHPAAMLRRAQVLLEADADGPDARPDERVADALDATRMTVMRVRQQFASEGLDATPHRWRPTGRQYRKLGGRQEAQLVAIACSPAPARAAPAGPWRCWPAGSWSWRWSARSIRRRSGGR